MANWSTTRQTDFIIAIVCKKMPQIEICLVDIRKQIVSLSLYTFCTVSRKRFVHFYTFLLYKDGQDLMDIPHARKCTEHLVNSVSLNIFEATLILKCCDMDNYKCIVQK